MTFNIKSDENNAEASLNKTITVKDYFAKKYKPLAYPHLPCVDARNGDQERAHWLPMEVVKVEFINKLNMFRFLSMIDRRVGTCFKTT